MKVLIIGGTNFIGLHTANEFANNGHDVTVFHRNEYTGNILSKKIKHILGNCLKYEELAEAIHNVEPDIVVDMYAMCEQDIMVLEKALIKQTRVLIASSLDVYEAYSVFSDPTLQLQVVPLTERSKLRTVMFPYRGIFDFSFAYDYEKILVEQASISNDKMDTVIVRLGMIYGENDSNHRFKKYIEEFLQKDLVTISEEESRWTVSKGYVKDIAYGIYLAACKGQSGEVYNLAEKEPVCEFEWIKRLAKIMKRNGRIEIKGNNTTGKNLKQNLILDTQKIRSALGYSEKYSIENALKNTLEWEKISIVS